LLPAWHTVVYYAGGLCVKEHLACILSETLLSTVQLSLCEGTSGVLPAWDTGLLCWWSVCEGTSGLLPACDTVVYCAGGLCVKEHLACFLSETLWSTVQLSVCEGTSGVLPAWHTVVYCAVVCV